VKRFILDASVSLAWFVDDPVPDLAVKIRKDLAANSTAVVPLLWHSEMANGFIVTQRRGAMTGEFVDRCLKDVEGLLASVIDSTSLSLTLRQIHTVAREFALTAYDAVYLETARRESLPLATLDRALIHAAMKARVPLIS
jgi:predicted nucleic acid-binding protein